MRFVLLFGPPAVGKMTVGRHLARLGNMRLFHNHAVLEPLLDVFDYGTPPFNALLNEFRQRVIEEAEAYGTDLIFTCVWGLDLQSDANPVVPTTCEACGGRSDQIPASGAVLECPHCTHGPSYARHS